MADNNKNELDSFRKELEEDIANFTDDTPPRIPRSSHHLHSTSSRSGSSSERVQTHSTTKHRRASSHHSSHHRRRKHRRRRLLCAVLAVIVLICAGGYGFVHWELNRINRNTSDEVTTEEIRNHLDSEDKYGVGTSNTEIISDPNITNFLLIGQDRREGDKAEMRSDAMIVCSINSKTKKITLCSLMRDMYVPVPGYGYGMLNHTYMIGGFSLLNETIEKNFGIPIDGDIEVDFNGFMELVDILGGINVNVTDEEASYINARKGDWNLIGGNNLLSSNQALYYCRIRENIGGDWGRTDRQRKVLMSAFNQLKQSGTTTMLNFAHQAIPVITTNVSNTKIIKYAYALASFKMDLNHSYRIPEEGSYSQEVREDNLHVLIPNLNAASSAIKQFLYK